MLLRPLLASFVCLAICLNCVHAASNDSTIVWDKFKESERKSSLQTEFDDKGLGPWFDFAVSFVNTVLNKEPYDLMLKAKDGKVLDDPVNDLALGYFIGITITAGIGALFCLIMPIVGCCFCCCRCCGKCGGEMSQKERPSDACKRAVFGVVLTIITLLMLTGVLLTFVCNERMSDTMDKLKDTAFGILDEAAGFVNDTVEEFDNVVSKDFPTVTQKITDDIEDAGIQKLVGDPLLKALEKGTIAPLEEVKKLSENTKKMDIQLTLITNNTESLQSEGENLNQTLNDVKKNLTDIKSNCSAVGVNCDGFDPDNVGTDADFAKVPNVTDKLENIQEITKQDFEKSAQKGLDTLKDIPNTIINKTADTRKDVIKLVKNATSQFDKYKEDLDKLVNDNVLTQVNKLKGEWENPFDEIKNYNKYRWYAGVGLSCILVIIVLLLALGLMCGICGHDKDATPTTRGSVSNMGGLSLMAAVGFCFIFSSLLMLLTTICFIIGTPLQKVCGTVQSGDIYSQFIDKPEYWNNEYIFAKALYNKPQAPVTVGGLLKNCRENQAAYKAASVHLVFNVSEKLNIKELLGGNTDERFESMKVNLSDQTILTDDTRKSLRDLADAGVEGINFDQFLNETRKGITKVNLTELAYNVSLVGGSFTNAAAGMNASVLKDKANAMAEKANATADTLRLLDQVNVPSMQKKSDELEKSVNGLKAIGNQLETDANNTLDAAEKAEEHLHSKASAEINVIVEDYSNRVLGYGYQFSDRIIGLLNNEMGKCKPLANIVDATVVLICNDMLYSFNGFWLAIGWCLFFFIPAIILAVKLAKHYRCMSYESDFDQEMGEVYEMGNPSRSAAPPPYNPNVGNEKKLWSNGNNHF